MDRLKHLVSKRLQTMPAKAHPAADMLSAFAENALSGSERQQVLAHLAACGECREIIYLAQPETAEAQTIRAFRPTWITSFAFRWGAVAASLVIIAGGLFLTREGRFHGERNASIAPKKNSAKTTEQARSSTPDVVLAPIETAPPAKKPLSTREGSLAAGQRPEEKHMTAQMDSALQFDSSDQIHVATPSRKDKDSLLDKKALVPPQSAAASAYKSDNATASNELARSVPQGRARDIATLAYSATPASAPALQGKLSGHIFDPSGVAIANAKITMNGPSGTKTSNSNYQGRFSFDELASGSYSLRAEADGFRPAEINQIAVLQDKRADLHLKLEVGNNSETVEVSKAPQIEAGMANPPDTPMPAAVAEAETTARSAQNEVVEVRGKSAASKTKPAAMGSATRPTSLAQWTLSSEGAVQRSSDAGQTWQKIPVAGLTDFRAIFASDRDVWVGGKAGALFHSSDSGTTWAAVIAAAYGEKLQSDVKRIEFTDSQNGTVITVNGEKWVTPDAGQTWRKIAR